MKSKLISEIKGKPLIKVPESKILKLILKEARLKGCILERVNSGAMISKTGAYIKFGWGEKSPDTIGGRQIIITQDMVGKTILQFMAREVKHSLWVYKGTPHEKAQKSVIDKINKMGGDACFANDVGTI